MKKKIIFASVILSFCLVAYKSQDKTHPKNPKINSKENQKINAMKTYISIFEIPANDISRAVDFYQTILDINIEKMEFPGMQMGIFPYEGQMVTGVIVQEEGYKPSAEGVTIYLNGGDDLQNILDKVEINGGEIITSKSLHADGREYYAIFIDSEGNKMGLHSPN